LSHAEQHHQGLGAKILAKRTQVYEQAKSNHPERWSGNTRNWNLVEEVYLNPEKKQSEIETNKVA
jgi:putative transposase